MSSKVNFWQRSVLASLLGLGWINLGFATAGTVDYGYGATSKAMGGTGVADPEDSLAPALNPAGIAYLDQQLDIGVSVFSPRRGYDAASTQQPFDIAPGKHWSDDNYFIDPQLGYTQSFDNQRGAFGVSLYGYGWMNTDYDKDISGALIGPGTGVYGGGDSSIDFKQMLLNVALAWKIVPQLSIGASLLPAMQSLEVKGATVFAPFSDSPNNVSNNGTDYSYGVGGRFGALFEPSQMFSAGISYQPKIHMTKLDDYKGFLPNHGELDIPGNGTVGISIHPDKTFTINADVERIWYENVDAYGNANNCIPGSGIACIGVENGAGFSWKNTNIYKLGAQWIANENWTVRAGYAYVTETIPSSSVDNIFNALSPGVVQSHYTVGLGYRLNQHFLLNPYFMYVPKVTVDGNNQFNSQDVSIFMREYELGASLSWKMA